MLFESSCLLVASLLALTTADDTYSPCPPMPSWDGITAAQILSDPGVIAALQKVDALLASSAAPLPTGLIATIVIDQTTAFAKGYGKRNAFATKPTGPPTTDNLVRIASITKVRVDSA